MTDALKLQKAFEQSYGLSPRLFSAPGRVNLIGEHTDYNEGFVLPMAVNRRTVVAAARREDSLVRVSSNEIKKRASFDLKANKPTTGDHWVSYIEGTARVLWQRGLLQTGADLAISSDVPIGAGLSSSAALEVSVGMAFVSLSGAAIELVQLALVAQEAEHIYAGTKCGIMDQLAAAFGQRGHALLIDCRSLVIKPVPLNIPGISVVVCNTNVKHDLAASAYNTRRAECEEGVEILRPMLPGIRALRDVSIADFNRYKDLLPQPIRRRCSHVVTENERTQQASEALCGGEIVKLGELMRLSHQSLRDDYEVSCQELDTMVDIALRQEGVAGARMTGGGFGGCTVNLVQQELLDSFKDRITREYQKAIGIRPAIYVVAADSGVSEDRILQQK